MTEEQAVQQLTDLVNRNVLSLANDVSKSDVSYKAAFAAVAASLMATLAKNCKDQQEITAVIDAVLDNAEMLFNCASSMEFHFAARTSKIN